MGCAAVPLIGASPLPGTSGPGRGGLEGGGEAALVLVTWDLPATATGRSLRHTE